MLIVEINVQFHLFQEVTNQFTAVIVSDKSKHKSQEMIDIPETIEVQDIPETIEVQDIPETIEVQDIPETIEVQDIPEMIEVQDLHLDENFVEIILDLTSHEVINFCENKRVSLQMVQTNFMKLSKKNCMKF